MASGDSRTVQREPYNTQVVDHLLRVFYSWEYRGRGWVEWDEPVDLEPPFRPFYWYLPHRQTPIDDGRRHTFLSRLVERMSGPSQVSNDFEQVQVEPEDPNPVFLKKTPKLVEVQITLPPDTKITRETSVHFLRSLSHCRHPLAFEFIGTLGEVVFQLTCSEDDYPHVENQLQGQFPDSVLIPKTDFLANAWGVAGKKEVVVEFGLSNEFMLPLATSRTFDPDPLTGVVSALSGVKEGETGVFQVLFQPTRKPWADSILRAVTDDNGDPVFDNFPSLLPFAKEKVSSPLYACIVRVAARSPKQKRAWKIAQGVGAALSPFSLSGGNELIPLENEVEDGSNLTGGLLLRFSFRNGMLLNVEELLSLAHLPSASLRAKKLKRAFTRTRPAPENTRGHSFILGENIHNGVSTTVSLNPEQRSRHLYAIGASGGGKSNFLLHMIQQDLEQGNGFALLDPHGDLVDSVIGLIPERRLDDAILFDPSDEEYPIGFNILKAHSDVEKSLLSSDLVSVFRRQSTSWGDQMNAVLANAIQAFLESTEGGTLNDMERFLIDREYRVQFLRTVQDLEIVYYWMKTFPLLSGRPQTPITTRLNTFFHKKRVRYMVAQKDSRLNVRQVMDGGKILLARLSQGAIGEENAYLLGSLLITQIYQAAMSRQDQRESERRPFYLYIDECHGLITPSVAAMLSGARKYKLSLILAHQFLDQLGKNELASSALANPFTRVVFKVSDQDAKKLADGFSHYDSNDLKNLGVGEAVARVERAEFDFNLSIPQVPFVSERAIKANREYILRNTREQYATPRAIVEASLAPRYADLFDEEPPPTKTRKKKAAKKDSVVTEPEEVEEPPPTEVRVRPKLEEILSQSPLEKPIEPLPPEPRPKPAFPPLAGRGKQEHKDQQELIKIKGHELGFLVTKEKLLPNGGSVDVALESDQIKIACEISVTTSADHEMGNIRKCLEAGFDEVVLIAVESERVEKLSAKIKATFPNEIAKVHCLTMPTFIPFLEAIAATRKEQTTTIRGRKVKARKPLVSGPGKGSKRDPRPGVVSRIVAQSIIRQKEGDGP